jgi:uncharacterized protein (UPF0303 family)
MIPTPEQDAAQIQLQESNLTLPHFDANVAWSLGSWLREVSIERKFTLVIDIRRFGRPIQPLFYSALPGTTPDNARWANRKANVVARFHRSSYAIGLRLESQGQTLTERHALPAAEYAPVGGSFPISVPASGGVIGAITISGLASRDDHNLGVEALCHHLEADYESLRLP